MSRIGVKLTQLSVQFCLPAKSLHGLLAFLWPSKMYFSVFQNSLKIISRENLMTLWYLLFVFNLKSQCIKT